MEAKNVEYIFQDIEFNYPKLDIELTIKCFKDMKDMAKEEKVSLRDLLHSRYKPMPEKRRKIAKMLSTKGYTHNTIAEVFQVKRLAVHMWLNDEQRVKTNIKTKIKVKEKYYKQKGF